MAARDARLLYFGELHRRPNDAIARGHGRNQIFRYSTLQSAQYFQSEIALVRHIFARRSQFTQDGFVTLTERDRALTH